MKKIFLAAALVAMGFASCTNDEAGSTIPQGNEGKNALIKVDLKSAGTITKAVGDYEKGTDNENKVSKIDFYFYAADGAPYSVTSANGNAINWTEGAAGANVDEVSDAILVIKQSQVAPPSKVVAIINSDVDYSSKNLVELGAEVINALHEGDVVNATNFVMSNSVYYDEDNRVEVVASVISQENIFTTNDENVLNVEAGKVITGADVTKFNITPIEIYVERVAAKVRVHAKDGVNLAKIPVYDPKDGTKQMKDAAGNPVYAKILGWDVTNATAEANLIKDIDGTWDATALGLIWNAQANYRSYWAKTTATPAHNLTFNALMAKGTPAYDYYFENTKPYAAENSVTTGAGNQASQLLVAAQLVDEDGDEIQLAKWYNVLYTIDDLKTAMINTIASKVYVFDREETVGGETVKYYKSVSVNDVTFYQTAATATDNRYEVLVKAKDGVTYYNAKGEVLATAATTIAAIEPAQMWTEGYTYYYTTIKHLGTAGAQYGIVRNHCYDITIDGVKGFGTPVYDPSMVIIPEPVDPQDVLNLAARINILSWQLVNQNVTLQ